MIQEERQLKALEFKKRMAEVMGKDYLYKKIERDYQATQQSELEREKEILNANRERYNPARSKNVTSSQ